MRNITSKKMDKLGTLMRTQQEHLQCSIMWVIRCRILYPTPMPLYLAFRPYVPESDNRNKGKGYFSAC